MTVFSEYARYYNLLYHDKNYAAESSYILSLLRRFRPQARSLLELGAGTGKHAALLAHSGYRVHGVEMSPQMLEQACNLADEQENLTFTAGDLREVRLGEKFDAVLSLFHVLSYQTGNEDLIRAFATIGEHLEPEGVLIFDCWYGPCVLTERPAPRVKTVSNDEIEVIRITEPQLDGNRNVVDVNYRIFVRDLKSGSLRMVTETHSMRYLFIPEIELLLLQHGFRLLHAEEWLTGRALGCDTFGACFAAQLR